MHPDLIDESTVGTFPGTIYHINMDLAVTSKRTVQDPYQCINRLSSKWNVEIQCDETSNRCSPMDLKLCYC